MYTIGKQTAKYDGKTTGQKFMFTLNITSTISDNLSVQLFNNLKSVVYAGTDQFGTFYNPFTIDGSEAILVTGNSVGIQTNGNLVYKKFGGTLLTASTPAGQNLTYRDIFNMIAAGQYLKMSQVTIISNLQTQLTQGTMNVVNISDLGVVTKKSVPLLTFYTPNQEQNNIIDLYVNTEICKNQGLEFSILPNSTTSFTFYLEA